MKLLFRADADTDAGTGHVMRCLALAQVAQDRGHETFFVTLAANPLQDRLRKEGCGIRLLSAPQGNQEDAAETLRIALDSGADWIVIDGYRFDDAYQRALKGGGLPLLFIDDYGHATPYAADIILNQNSYAPGVGGWYARRPASSRLLLGCAYTLLRREFRSSLRPDSPIPARASSVLVTLGGSDPRNATLLVIEALRSLGEGIRTVRIVVGKANPHLEGLRAAAGEENVIVDAADMPALMAQADLAIAAGGTTSYELAFMGIPSLLFTLAENQRQVAEDLAEREAARSLGDPNGIAPPGLAQAIRELLGDPDTRTRFSRNGRKLVDGGGAERVLRAMEPPSASLRLRPATVGDGRTLWEWANDPTVRASAFSSDPIPWEEHMQWFGKKLRGESS
ncbi:MAG: UDP-2,4-diacetamido-2,4,6-trideoxy-beta-L-altropyranose hydrolase, partial [Patescibacteria group bacterium]